MAEAERPTGGSPGQALDQLLSAPVPRHRFIESRGSPVDGVIGQNTRAEQELMPNEFLNTLSVNNPHSAIANIPDPSTAAQSDANSLLKMFGNVLSCAN